MNINFNNWDNIDENNLDNFFLLKRNDVFYLRNNIIVLYVNEKNVNKLKSYIIDNKFNDKFNWFNNNDFNFINVLINRYKKIYLIFIDNNNIGYLIHEPFEFKILNF